MDAKRAEFLQQTFWQEFASREEIETPTGYPHPEEIVETASGHIGYVVMWLGPRADNDGPCPNEPAAIIKSLRGFAQNAEQLPHVETQAMVPISQVKVVRPI